jgi:hypothetical protein
VGVIPIEILFSLAPIHLFVENHAHASYTLNGFSMRHGAKSFQVESEIGATSVSERALEQHEAFQEPE